MVPQFTLQAPLKLPPQAVINHLEQLWRHPEEGYNGSATFTLVVWEPAWLEQHLARLGLLQDAVMGMQRPCLVDAARRAIGAYGLPSATAPLSHTLAQVLASQSGGNGVYDDLRGQAIESSISELQPHRMITLAPTINGEQPLDALVAAYCSLPEENSPGGSVCGDVLVLRGGAASIAEELDLLPRLIPSQLPCWVLWEGALGEHTDIFERLVAPPRRLIVDTALGETEPSLRILAQRIASGQAVSDLNWYRLGGWRESLAMAFDAQDRRAALGHVAQVDIDVEGDQLCQGLLLAAWIASRLQWSLRTGHRQQDSSVYRFQRPDGITVDLRLVSVPVGFPKPHAGSVLGLRLLCKPPGNRELCVVLCGEASGCMRLEGGDISSRDLVEEIVPLIEGSLEVQETRALAGGHDTTNPLLATTAQLADQMLATATAAASKA
ncbi:glucose 6-phosphate dehydrogenase [Candidatus Synechococcus spongiarum LMB bulk15M]|uniref:Glucose 6-phosphate dehydrogenase n=1 Tax=Candidatus Synechococcus spongiarum LMB bulk15M TaxID=1943582 RepID=A0A1T1D3Z4_9SYNE|nr:glucose 6-phosphate dehydrogenase [Candidatus Synechococcus spongiarum LMB bulk15M]